MVGKEHDLNQATYRKMETVINETFPYGRFVGIVGGQIVADAADFDELQAVLEKAGKEPKSAFIIQAGHDYPENAVIFLDKRAS